MAVNKFLASVQSFVHSITTQDRYASYEHSGSSAYSRPRDDASTALGDDTTYRGSDGFSQVTPLGNDSTSSLDRLNSSKSAANASSTSLNRMPYTPGMRSQQIGNGGIPLQDYAEGVAPPPAPGLSWQRIDRWVEANYPELHDQLSDPVTAADLNELENDLDCSLPLDVRDSYIIHDGQERGGRPTGLFFGITLLDLEGISEEWSHWKNTAIRINNQVREHRKRATAGPPPSIGSSRNPQAPTVPLPPRLSWLERQESAPDGAVQRVYAHPRWIPLCKDFEGNNVAIDLAPGPKGRWGQVILFGRNFDRKYVVAPSWAAFLSTFADDLESGNHYVDDDVENGCLMFRAPNGRLMSYFDVLRSRVDRSIRLARKAAAPAQATNHPYHPSARIPRRDGSGSRSSTPRQSLGNLISPMHSTTSLPSTADDKGKGKVKDTDDKLSDTKSPKSDDKHADQVSSPEVNKAEAVQQAKSESEEDSEKAKDEPEAKPEAKPEEKSDEKSDEKPEESSVEKSDETPAEELDASTEPKESKEPEKSKDSKESDKPSQDEKPNDDDKSTEPQEDSDTKPNGKANDDNDKDDHEQDEVDMLKEDLTEVEI